MGNHDGADRDTTVVEGTVRQQGEEQMLFVAGIDE
jgi:hypothetical protein